MESRELEYCQESPRSPTLGVDQTQLMRQQYHFWPGTDGLDAWNVDRLIERTVGLKLRRSSWRRSERSTVSTGSTTGRLLRCGAEHCRLIQEADLSHPIILGPDGRVMDGMHRVARALLDSRTSIRAFRLPELPDPDYRNCHAEDLPY